jgi:hypothetical protein
VDLWSSISHRIVAGVNEAKLLSECARNMEKMSANFTGIIAAIRGRNWSWKQRDASRWVVFFLCLLTFGLAQFNPAFTAANRFKDVEKADWSNTNVWLKAAECTRESGAWLSICIGDKLVPISEHALAEDPGHALLLGLFARLKDRNVTIVDVVRLNIVLNAAGLALLAGFLFTIRAYVVALVLLALGGGVYFGWLGVSPHSGLIGVASMAAILPMALVAKEMGWVSRRVGYIVLALGLLTLSFTALIRGSIGSMGFVVSIGTLVAIGLARPRANQRLLSLLVVGLLMLITLLSPRWVVMARDAIFPMEPAYRIQSHGTSHNLYIGLGVVDNQFGIRWDDSFAADEVKKVAPAVLYVSPEYYRILWRLYFARVLENPAEVVRIYLKKSGQVLEQRYPEWAPPLWSLLLVAIVLLRLARKRDSWRQVEFDQGSTIVIVALAFIGFFIAQGVAAHPDRQYAAPISVFVLLLLGAALEFFCRSQWSARSEGKLN